LPSSCSREKMLFDGFGEQILITIIKVIS
jgi:hypothetical protein